MVGMDLGRNHAVKVGKVVRLLRLWLWSMTTRNELPARTSGSRHGDAARGRTGRHDEVQDPMSVLVRHLARQAARQLFRPGDAPDCPQAVSDHTMAERSDW